MKSFIIVTIALFWCNSAQALISADLKAYYHFVNQAELSLLDSNYNRAISLYRTAFTHKSTPFIKDRFNLALCYALQDKHRKCYEQLKWVIDKGVTTFQLKKRSELNGFFDSKWGLKLSKYEHTHARTYNPKYRAAIDSLVRMDQEFRNKEGGYEVYGDTIRKIDSLNVIALNNLISLYGFPSEDLIGVDSTLQLARPIYNVVIIHQQHGAQNHFWDYSSMISAAIDQGEIEVHAAAEYLWKCSGKDNLGVMNAGLVQLVIDSTGNNSSGNVKPDRSKEPFGYFKMTPEKEMDVNGRRDSLGMETLIQAREKTAFMQRDRRFMLPSSTVSVLVCTSQAQYAQMSKSVIWL